MPTTVGIDEVEINSKTYRLKGALQEGLVEEFPDNERQSGQQHLSDRRGKSAWLVKEVLGLGQFYSVDNEERLQAQKSYNETRFGEVTNGLLRQDSTGQTVATTPSVQLVQFASDLGWFRTDAAATTKARVGAWSPDTWADGTIVSMDTDPSSPTLTVQTSSNNMLAAHVLKDSLVVYFFDHSTNADTRSLNVTTMTAWGAGTWVGRIFSFTTGAGDVIKAITWNTTTSVFGVFDASANTITVYKNTNNWASTATTTLATISAGAFNGMCIYYDLAGNLKVMVGTDVGVWAVDVTTANNESLVVDLTNQADTSNCLGMVVWNGRLVVPLGDGSIEAREWGNGGMASYTIRPKNPITGLTYDRLPSGWEGHVTASLATEDYLYIAYGGHAASQTAHIFAVDNQTMTWHYVMENDTANEDITHMIISSENDGQQRLHYITEYGADFFHIDDVTSNPRHKSIPSALSSKLTLPEFTGGFPHVDKCFLQLLVDPEDLSATNADQYINVDYGLDDNVVDTDLGNFLSGTKVLTFGSGAGVSGRTLTLQLDFIRDASVNTHRSYVRALVLEYLVIPDRRETYEFVVDCDKTALGRGGRDQVKDIIDELNTIQASKTMVTLSFDGRTAVRVIAEPKTITEQELATRFQVTGYSHRVDRYLKLTELL